MCGQRVGGMPTDLGVVVSKALTDRESYQALLDGEELLDVANVSVRMRGETLEFMREDTQWDPVGNYSPRLPLRRPAPEPATFAQAIPHLLAGRKAKRVVYTASNHIVWREGLLRSIPSNGRPAIDIAATDWLVQIDGRWVSAAKEVPK